MNSNLKDRIRELMNEKKLTQQEFAELLHISPASLSGMFNDRSKPTLNHVNAIMKCFPSLNPKCLICGEGKMFAADVPDANSPHVNRIRQSSEPLLIDFDNNADPARQEKPPVKAASPTPIGTGVSSPQNLNVKVAEKINRQITEIRIFYDDQTWETFLPKK